MVIEDAKRALEEEYACFQSMGLKLNMARGKPCAKQLELSAPLMQCLAEDDYKADDGTDCRNYGVLDGIPEAKALMGSLMGAPADRVIVYGTSSLNAMFDVLSQYCLTGVGAYTPWKRLMDANSQVKWLCPVPGYDRHFAMTEYFGMELIPVPMDEHGPDMDLVESLVAADPLIKGMWCVPQYSNPGGVVYSDEVVKRLASMQCAAPDFKIFWDNAYCVHHLYREGVAPAHVASILDACSAAGNPERAIMFCSTSKLTFPGAGVSAIAAGPATREEILDRMRFQTIGHDKLNQLRHVRFLKDAQGVEALMRKHADVIRPKFELIDAMLQEAFGQDSRITWTKPDGGYFILLQVPQCAKRVVKLCAGAGVVLTAAGSTWPYGDDPNDSDIRLAPTIPSLEELRSAMEVLICSIRLALVE